MQTNGISSEGIQKPFAFEKVHYFSEIVGCHSHSFLPLDV